MHKDLQTVSAVLFLNPNGIDLSTIERLTSLDKKNIKNITKLLTNKYKSLGLELIEQNDRYLLVVSKDITKNHNRLVSESEQLSNSALEVLSIIAYNQPISRDEIENIRGIGSEQSIRGLLERELIEEKSQKISGILHIKYVTTVIFLKQLGIRSLSELPKKEEVNEPIRAQG